MENQWHLLIRNLLATGMTQTQIAMAIGVTQGAVSQVLNSSGKRGFGFIAGTALVKLHSQHCPDASLIWPDIPPPRENPNNTVLAGAHEPEGAHG